MAIGNACLMFNKLSLIITLYYVTFECFFKLNVQFNALCIHINILCIVLSMSF